MKRAVVTFAATFEERRDIAQELQAFADRLRREKSPGAKKRADRVSEIAGVIGGLHHLEDEPA